MNFAYPQVLWASLVLVPALILFLVWSWRTKQKLIAQFVTSRLLANLTVGVSHFRQKMRLVLLGAAVLFGLIAVARPQWGFDWEEAHVRGLDILVAIDTSKSMLANDVSPNRLARAKLAAFDLMKLAKSDRLGLIAFAGSAFLQSPLTLDEEAFRQNVETLDVNIIPQGGTALGEAIDTAVKAFETSGDNHKVLVLFTDGEDQDTGATDAAERAAKAGIKIYTIGVGTAEGELIRVPGENGAMSFLKDDQGNVVKSHLNESLLQKIATTGGGFYLPLRGPNPMETLYHHPNGLGSLPKSESTAKLVRNYRERFQWPLLLAFLALVAEMFLPNRRLVRAVNGSKGPSNATTAKVVGLVMLLLLPITVFSSPSAADAIKEFQAGKYQDALTDYQKLLKQKTNDYRLYYNAGVAAYKAKRLGEAAEYFDKAAQSPDLKLQQRSIYNSGNTAYQAGEALKSGNVSPDALRSLMKQAGLTTKEELDQATDPSQSAETVKTLWNDALRNYQNALRLDANDADAKNNIEFVKKKLEELEREQPKQQQSKNDKSKDDKKEDSKNQNQQNDKKDKQDQKKQQDKKDQQQQRKDQQQQQAKDQEQQKQDQAKQDQQQKQQKGQDDKRDQQQAQQAKKNDDQQKEQGEGEPAGKTVQMTPEQAAQFLEAMKQEDKALIFKPPQKETRGRVLKDW